MIKETFHTFPKKGNKMFIITYGENIILADIQWLYIQMD